MNQIVDQGVDGIDRFAPGTADVAERGALAELAFLADDPAEPAQFAGPCVRSAR